MKLNWPGWSYDLFRSVIRSMCVAFTVWGGYTVKYADFNWNDLFLALAIGGGLRGVMAFLETRPLPEDLDAKVTAEVTKQLDAK